MAAPDVAGVQAHWDGDRGDPIVIVGGPPASARLFRAVQARLRPRRTVALDLVAGPRVPDVESLCDRLASAMVELQASTLVVHGLAVPLGWRVPAAVASRLIVSNGPVAGLHPVPRALAALPGPLWERLLLEPRLAGRWMASSAALRRVVVNPYVMGRDTVDLLLADLITDPDARANTATWITGLARLLPLDPARGGQVDGIWGDRDQLHPMAGAEGLLQGRRGATLTSIPGGQWLHPEERPWALADGLCSLLGA